VSNCNNNNNNNKKKNNNNYNNFIKINIDINAKKVLVASISLVLLLSSTIFNQNQIIILLSLVSSQHQQEQSSLYFLSSLIPSLAYADKIKIKNKSLINDISDQLVKNNGNNGKDELQNILQQVQMQISLIAGQDKATNAIKEIESVIELNPNGPLAQSLLFLAKQQSTGNIEDVNKVTTDIARNAAAGGDSVVGLLEQSVANTTATTANTTPPPSSSIIPPSSQQQQQQEPSQSPPLPTSTIASFGNNSSSDNVDNNLEQQPSSQSSLSAYPSNNYSSTSLRFMSSQTAYQSPTAQLPSTQASDTTGQPVSEAPLYKSAQHDQQQIQPQSDINQHTLSTSNSSSMLSSSVPSSVDSQNQQLVHPQSFPAPPPSLQSQTSLHPNASNSNNSNSDNQDNIAPNSTPHSAIKITSIEQPTEHIYRAPSLPESNSTKQPNQSNEREQLQQQIQEILNGFNTVNRNDGASLPTYVERY
jgi:hypothetical protein